MLSASITWFLAATLPTERRVHGEHANEIAELTEYVALTCCQSRHSRLVPLSGVSEDCASTFEKYGISGRKYLMEAIEATRLLHGVCVDVCATCGRTRSLRHAISESSTCETKSITTEYCFEEESSDTIIFCFCAGLKIVTDAVVNPELRRCPHLYLHVQTRAFLRHCLAWSPSSHFLASGSEDMQVTVWLSQLRRWSFNCQS